MLKMKWGVKTLDLNLFESYSEEEGIRSEF